MQSAWEDARTTAVMDLLDRHRPQPGQDDLRGFEWFYWYRLCHSELLTFEGGGGYPAYSPDGKRLAAVSADSTVKVWDVATRQEILTLKGRARTKSGAWSSARTASSWPRPSGMVR